jgi:hypothetical protein
VNAFSPLIEFAARRGLLGPNAPGHDLRLVIIFAANGRTGQPPQQTNLADVRQRIRDGALK